MEEMICPACGVVTKGVKFCTECGAFLNKKHVVKKTLEKKTVEEKEEPEVLHAPKADCLNVELESPKIQNTSVSDQGLELLINTCKKTLATIGGDGYTEYVLYKRAEDVYELHYYSKYVYMEKEVHLAYKSSKAIVEEAYKRIDELDLDSYEEYQGDSLTGGMRILKYKRGNELTRLTTDNLPMEKHSYLYEIERIITKTATDEYRMD